MSWQTPTIDDLRASLGSSELDTLRTKSVAEGQDVVAQILARVVAMVRAAARRSGCLMGPAGTIPAEALQPLCNIAAFELLTRLNIELRPSRTTSRDAAMKWLEDLAAGKWQVVGYGQDETTVGGVSPHIHPRDRQFGRDYEQGL